MSYKNRINQIHSQIPKKAEVKFDEDAAREKAADLLLESNHPNHVEYLDCIKRLYRLHIKGSDMTEDEKTKYDRLVNRIESFIKENC